MTGHKMKQIKVWASWVTCCAYIRLLYLVVFSVIFGHPVNVLGIKEHFTSVAAIAKQNAHVNVPLVSF